MSAQARAHQSFIADGFTDDCDELMRRCLKHTPLCFTKFSEIFREMELSCLYNGRQTGAEIAELSEEVVNIAKYYMIADTSNFEESVVGLFLVYALIETQPFENFAYLRLVGEDVPFVERIEQIARRERRIDVLYVLGKTLMENTRYLVGRRERGMEPAYRKYIEGYTDADIPMRARGVFMRQNEELDIIKELEGLQLRYCQMKNPLDTTEMNYTDPKFAVDLDTSLNNIVAGINVTNDDEEVEVTARTIKEKAMKIKVNPIKHLMAIQERSPANKTYSSEIKSSPGKIKTNSPTKPVNKKLTPVATGKRKRDSSSSSNESELSIDASDDDSDFTDLDLGSFNKPQSSTNDTQELEVPGDLNLESLPSTINTDESGQRIEIEIVDQMQTSTTGDTNSPQSLFNAKEETSKSRKDKRYLKKTILKSRFRRMGMDPVANFKS